MYGSTNGSTPLLGHSDSVAPGEMKKVAVVVGLFQVAMLILFSVFCVYDNNKTFLDTQYTFFLDVTVMMLVGFGYLMTFMRDYGLGAVGLTFLITTMSLQWCILTGRFFASAAANNDYPELVNATKTSDFWVPVEININALLQGDFAAAAVLISFGALIGKISPAQTALLALIEVPLYSLNKEVFCIGHLGTLDMGGTIFIHLFGAYFGLAISWILGPPPDGSTDNAEPSKSSDIFSLIGTVFLWIYWPSFNGATAPLGQAQQNLTTANTVLALCGSCLTTFVVSTLFNRKFNTVDIQNATLAGGVCVGAASNLKIGPGGAIAVGMVAGLVSTCGFNKLQNFLEEGSLKLHDSCGVHNLHGLPALLGSVVVIIATSIDSCRGDVIYVKKDQNLAQLWGMLTTFAFAIVTGLITGKVLKLFGGDMSSFRDGPFWTVAEKKD
eukprot:CAMPEP_0175127412 /NCGR_PEP_ID=MMETSP0087-20121206/4372_1 /TAXON_ID=136419 /ORGANISM="Unknown Unknown, Strain D1" /LENGTH=439 /DNA_ID=CAMNT_0016409387 /DNA_START=40 /DNA_END=1359 /DNA_ORIENTATION=+